MGDDVQLQEPVFVDVPGVDQAKHHQCRFFRIDGLSDLAHKKRVMRDVDIGKYKWHVTVSAGFHSTTHLSTFIKVPEDAQDFYRPIRFQFSVVNQRDLAHSYLRETVKTLTKAGMDWGFKQFVPLDELHDTEGLVVDDSVIIGIYIFRNVYRRPKKGAATGHVGLRNQGATCYMNSLLQSLFFLDKFRKLVYDTANTEAQGKKADELVKGLRKIFYRLQFSPRFVDTVPLTRALGWDLRDAFMQHDVQEFSALLIDKLETQLKGTDHEKELLALFEGSTLNYIRCVNVDYESSRKETIREVQLSVKGCNSLHDAFVKYCREERMEGDNKYQAEGHGMQDAVMGVKFAVLPPVLQLHLMRYEYDPERDAMAKIHDRCEFDEHLDLSQFVDRQEGDDAVYTYTLHSVMVHSGDGHAGHYRTFIRVPPKPPQQANNNANNNKPDSHSDAPDAEPMEVDSDAKPLLADKEEDKEAAEAVAAVARAVAAEDHRAELAASSSESEGEGDDEGEEAADGRKWVIFDDELVHEVKRRYVFGQSFGGHNPDGYFPPLPRDAVPPLRTTSAYMLVYIRDSERDQVLCEVPADAIPPKVAAEGAEVDEPRAFENQASAYAYSRPVGAGPVGVQPASVAAPAEAVLAEAVPAQAVPAEPVGAAVPMDVEEVVDHDVSQGDAPQVGQAGGPAQGAVPQE